MAIMAIMSTAMLGMGQGNILLPGLTLLAAVTSVVFTDTLSWFCLNRVVANTAMLLAAIFSLWGFMETDSRQQLHAIAHLLIYVQMVLLFQEKNRRVYGQLAMFSLLQVVVASLLNNRLEFGFFLAGYMVIALLGFVLFFVYREVGRVGMMTRRRSWWELGELAPEPLDALPDGLPVIQVLEQGTVLNSRIVTRKILPPISAMFTVTVAFTIVLFYTTPRTGGANWQGSGARLNMVGFSPEVSFEDMGKLLLSDARVMRVSFTNIRNGEPYTVIGEPYFRGGVLVKYLTSQGRGRWWQENESNTMGGLALPSPPNTRDLVRQDILLEPTGSDRLFSMFPVYGTAQSPAELRIAPRTRRLFRSEASDRDLRDEYRYTIATTAFNFGAQVTVIPHPNRLQTEHDRREMDRSVRWLRLLENPEAFPRLIALANEIVKEQAPGGSVYERARALEAHLAESELYRYTLDLDAISAQRRFDVDPIEDFVANHRTGHCEYFASALTLMLRSQGIPARLVVGYHGGELNYVGNYYLVRQRDAHAWVEAYLAPHEIPDGTLYPEEQHAGGGWLRLDPTPLEQRQNPLSQLNLLDRVSKSLDYARWLWNDYVMRLTEDRQRSAVPNPLALDHRFSLAQLLKLETWEAIGKRLTGTDLSQLRRGNLSWRGALAAGFACIGVYLRYRMVRALWPLLRLLRRRRPKSGRLARNCPVEFYLQLESALARLGLHREVWQTQRQFAREAARSLASSAQYAAVADIPDQIVEAFYGVRFGHRLPDAQQQAEIRRQLQTLEQTLAEATVPPSLGQPCTSAAPS